MKNLNDEVFYVTTAGPGYKGMQEQPITVVKTKLYNAVKLSGLELEFRDGVVNIRDGIDSMLRESMLSEGFEIYRVPVKDSVLYQSGDILNYLPEGAKLDTKYHDLLEATLKRQS